MFQNVADVRKSIGSGENGVTRLGNLDGSLAIRNVSRSLIDINSRKSERAGLRICFNAPPPPRVLISPDVFPFRAIIAFREIRPRGADEILIRSPATGYRCSLWPGPGGFNDANFPW